ncbi:hypothetical protein QJQ45_002148 [Haematococcus lacustris]|nr:hypothetical protein QJQ45_002148 [Haematococcus lacustris]
MRSRHNTVAALLLVCALASVAFASKVTEPKHVHHESVMDKVASSLGFGHKEAAAQADLEAAAVSSCDPHQLFLTLALALTLPGPDQPPPVTLDTAGDHMATAGGLLGSAMNKAADSVKASLHGHMDQTAAATENVRLKSGGRAQAAADELAAAAEKALHASKGHAASHEDPRGTVGKILDSVMGKSHASASDRAADVAEALHIPVPSSSSHHHEGHKTAHVEIPVAQESAGWTGERHEQQVVDVREMGLGSEAVPEGVGRDVKGWGWAAARDAVMKVVQGGGGEARGAGEGSGREATLQGLAGELLEKAKRAVNDAGNLLRTGSIHAANSAEDTVMGAKAATQATGDKAMAGAKDGAASIIGKAREMADAAADAVRSATASVTGSTHAAAQTASAEAKDVADSAQNSAHHAHKVVKGAAVDAADTVSGHVKGAQATARHAANTASDAISSTVKSGQTKTAQAASTVQDAASSTASRVAGAAGDAVDAVRGAVAGAVGAVQDAVSGAAGAVHGAVRDTAGAVSDAADSVVGGVKAGAQAVADKAHAVGAHATITMAEQVQSAAKAVEHGAHDVHASARSVKHNAKSEL